MTYNQRIEAFARWGEFVGSDDPQLQALIGAAQYDNAWFTSGETGKALRSLASMLNRKDLARWFSEDFPAENSTPAFTSRNIGLVLAGNIPLVGFHDVLCVLATGHKALIKLSSNDKRLLPFLLQKLTEIEPEFAGSYEFIERLAGFDAVIATGSGNTSRYFDYYFSKVPNIIRKNRTSIAVLDGHEDTDGLLSLGRDIFDYFGLGCRNVSKLYVPAGYDLTRFLDAIEPFAPIADHHKYNNNYDYNKSIMLVNGDTHLDNGFLLVRADARLASPLAVVHYEEYGSRADLREKLTPLLDNIQVIAANHDIDLPVAVVPFGQTQQPCLWDYADGVNTVRFLATIPNPLL